MATPHPQAWLGNIDRWGSICSIVAFFSTGFGFLRGILTPTTAAPTFAGPERLMAVLFVGLLAAAVHGILWSLAERLFDWKFEAGGRGTLPEGWSAVVLSATMTVPLIFTPLVYQALVRLPIVPPRHLGGGACAICGAALGHLLMYGSKGARFAGLRRRIAPVRKKLTLPTALLLEALWACVHFASITLAYRIVVASSIGDLRRLLVAPLLGASVFFFGMVTFILLRYPGSLRDRTWIQVRGVLAGIILLITLQGSMLM